MSNTKYAQAITQHIHDNISKYYPCLDAADIDVRLKEEQQRTSSSLYRFEVVNHSECYRVFAKGIPVTSNTMLYRNTIARARLTSPLTNYGERLWLEYTALRAIRDYFEKLGNPDFGSIRVLDFMENPRTIIMEENNDPNLLSLIVKTSRLRHPFGARPDLRRTFFNAGAWLKAYSNLPKTENVRLRNTSRADYNESIEKFTSFLGKIIGNASFFERVAEIAISTACQVMPDELPLALGHGDYAMRNILVGEKDRITVIDTGAKWRVPIYEDIAYFLINLKVNKLQIFTQGLAIHAKTIDIYESEILSGYFGQAHISKKLIKLFQIQALLDSWSSRASNISRQTTGKKAIVNKIHLILLNRIHRNIMKRLLNEL